MANKGRVTVITSFRPRSLRIRDESTLASIRQISDPDELYIKFCQYRLANARRLLEPVTSGLKKKDCRGAEALMRFTLDILQDTSNELAEVSTSAGDSGALEIVSDAVDAFRNMEEALGGRSDNKYGKQLQVTRVTIRFSEPVVGNQSYVVRILSLSSVPL